MYIHVFVMAETRKHQKAKGSDILSAVVPDEPTLTRTVDEAKLLKKNDGKIRKTREDSWDRKRCLKLGIIDNDAGR
jgi:hypothetical protein